MAPADKRRDQRQHEEREEDEEQQLRQSDGKARHGAEAENGTIIATTRNVRAR